MTRTCFPAATAIVLMLAAPSMASAADKTHQQIMAEIRMLQEQQQQLQQILGTLADTLKVVVSKIDDQTGATRKGFADQKLLVDNVAEGVRVLREKADDTNVRLSSMTQELEAVRQTIASLPAPAAAPPTGDPAAGDPLAPLPGATAPPSQTPSVAPPPNVSPRRMYDNAYADYTAGQYDLAELGFKTYISMFPRTDQADDAQLYIGNSLYGARKYRDAVAAYQRVITDFPQGDAVPTAYYKLGQTYEQLQQVDLAKKAYETLIQKYKDNNDVQLARTRLDALNRR